MVVFFAVGDVRQHGGGGGGAGRKQRLPEAHTVEGGRLEPLRRGVKGCQGHAARAVGAGNDKWGAIPGSLKDADARQGLGGQDKGADRAGAGQGNGGAGRADDGWQQAAEKRGSEAAGVYAAADDEVAAPGHPAAQGVRLGLGERIQGRVAAEQKSIHAAVAGRLVGEICPGRLGDLGGGGLAAGEACPGGRSAGLVGEAELPAVQRRERAGVAPKPDQQQIALADGVSRDRQRGLGVLGVRLGERPSIAALAALDELDGNAVAAGVQAARVEEEGLRGAPSRDGDGAAEQGRAQGPVAAPAVAAGVAECLDLARDAVAGRVADGDGDGAPGAGAVAPGDAEDGGERGAVGPRRAGEAPQEAAAEEQRQEKRDTPEGPNHWNSLSSRGMRPRSVSTVGLSSRSQRPPPTASISESEMSKFA